MSQASRIPRLSTAGKVTRLSSASSNPLATMNSNIPRPSLSKNRNSIAPSKYFANQPKSAQLNERKLPQKYFEKIHEIHRKNLDFIFEYTKKIAESYFKPQFHQAFFPPGLVAAKKDYVSRKTEANSRIPIKKEIHKFAKSVGEAFACLNDLVDTDQKVALKLTDFCLLYPSLIMCISEGEKSSTNAVSFVRKFLALPFPERTAETNVLFSSVFCLKVRSPAITGLCKQILAKLAENNRFLMSKLQKGCVGEDLYMKDLCQGAMNEISVSNGEIAIDFAKAGEIKISDVTDTRTAVLALLSLSEKEDIGEPDKFICSVVLTMQQFHDPAVVSAGCSCVASHLNEISPIDSCALGELLYVIFYTLGFSDGGGDELDSKTAADGLVDALMNTREVNNLIAAGCWAANFLEYESCEQMVTRFKESGFSEEDMNDLKTIVAMHRGELDDPNATAVENSVRKLLCPVTVFGEADRVINQTNDFSDYPKFIQGFLQRYYYLHKNQEPEGISENEKIQAKRMLENYQTMTVDDITGEGEFTSKKMMYERNELKKRFIQTKSLLI